MVALIRSWVLDEEPSLAIMKAAWDPNTYQISPLSDRDRVEVLSRCQCSQRLHSSRPSPRNNHNTSTRVCSPARSSSTRSNLRWHAWRLLALLQIHRTTPRSRPRKRRKHAPSTSSVRMVKCAALVQVQYVAGNPRASTTWRARTAATEFINMQTSTR